MSERRLSTRALVAIFAFAVAATFGFAPVRASEPPASRDLQAPLTAQPEPSDARNPNPLGQIEQDEPTAELAPEIAITCNGAGGPWNAPGTWSPAQVPTAADSVTISTGCTVTIDTAALALSVAVENGGVLEYDAATAQSLTVTNSVQVQSGGTLRTPATGTVTTHVLSVGGDLVNSGTLDFSTNGDTAGAGITFTGAGTNSFTGSGAITNIRTLTVNKGTSFANILDLSPSNLTVQGTTTDGAPMAFLTLTNGTLRVSGTFTLAGRVFTAAAYSIPATAGFWLNNPNFSVSGQNGSPTNNGLLRLTSGTYNVGTGSGNSMGTGTGCSFIIEGGTLNVAGRLSGGSTFVTYTQSNGTVNVSTVGNAASTTPSFGFTGTTGNVMNLSGGTINLVQASTGGTPVDYNQTGTMNYTGGTLNVGTGATATNFLFRIQGQIPAVVLDTTTNNKNANLSGQGNVWGTLTVNPGTTLNLNAQTLLMIGPTITNNGAISVTANNTGSVNFAGGLQQAVPAYPQSYVGTGTVGTAALRLASFALQNPLGVTLDPAVSVFNIYRVNAFYGLVTNSDRLALGNADAVALVVQRGATGIPFAAGSLDVAPVFSIGAGGLTLVYAQSATMEITGPEIPGTRTVLSFQVLNPTGVTVAGGPVSCTAVTNCLLLNTGTLFTTGANLFTVTNTAAASLAGGSGASYVNGPLARTLPASLVSGSTYTFPVGQSSFKMFELVNATTSAGGPVVVQAEVFDANSGGTAGAGFGSINTNRYWKAAIAAGAPNFINTTVRLTEQGTPAVNAIGRSATPAGAYASIGGAVTPPAIGPSTPITALDFFVVGTLAAAPTICGNSNVGVGGDFPTLTAAVAALNSRLMVCPVTFTLIDNTYPGEAFPIQINPNGGASAVNTFTIKPAPGIAPVFTGTAGTALIVLNGADYVTIDGSNTVGGTTRDTSFMNTSASTTSAVIWGQTIGTNDPATNNTIKNLNVAGSGTTATLVGIGFGSSAIGTGSLGTRNDNNRIQNNAVASLQFGIYSQGASSPLKNVGTVVTGNVLGGPATAALGRAGIFVGFDDGVQITNNTINGVTAANSADVFGIALGSIAVSATTFTTNNDVANAVVTGNVIGPVVKTDTFSAAGISMATNNYGQSRIANNVVFGVVANGTSGDFCVGIYVGNAGTAYSTTQVYHNSVSMSGPRDAASLATQPSFAFAILGNNPLVDLRDNVFYNTQTAANGGPAGLAGSYAIGLTSTTPYTNFTSDYNDLFTSGASSHFAMTTSLVNLIGDRTTLAAWQAATGEDANSLSVDPLFVSASDLHLQVTSPVIAKGTPIAGLTTDIDNQPRDLTAPDIGADEVVPRPFDLSVTKTDGVTTATPGGGVIYTIVASNAGPGAVPSANVLDTFPGVLTCTWTCAGAGGGTCTAAGAGNVNDTANLPAGGSATYTVTCSIAASATGSLVNTASVAPAPGDTNPANDSATDTDTLVPSSDAGITKTDGVTTVIPGGTTTYTIVASNAGPSDTTGTVADTFPGVLTCTWTCIGAGGGTCTAAGAGNINDAVTLPAGGSVTYTVPCNISGAATGTIANTATVAAVADTNGANDSATDTDTVDTSADLSITKTDGVTSVPPGGSTTYTIVAANAGPTGTTGTVADTFPADLTCNWTCVGAGGGVCTGAGAGNISDPVTLPAGGSVTYTVPCTVSPSASGTIVNTATVTGVATDPNPANNSATDTDVVGVAGTFSSTNEVEPNDTFATATPLGTNSMVAYGGVYPAADVDFYSFTAAANDQVYAAVQTLFDASASGDSVLDLLDTDGTTILETDLNDGTFTASSSSIAGKTLLNAGTYFLRVRHNVATGTIRPYQLRFRRQSGTPAAEVEPNNTPATATLLPASGWASGTITAVSPGEADFYSLTLAAGDSVYLSLDMNPERDANVWNGRLGFGLFGNPPSNQILLANDANAGASPTDPNSEAFFFTVLTGGTYYVYVDSIVAAGLGPNATYTLSVAVHPAVPATPTCTTYTSTDVPQTIPTGPGLVSSTITVPGNPRIADLDVSINLNHTFMQDIDAHLVSPAGNDNGLFTDIGAATVGGPQTLMDIRLDDEAALPPAFALSSPFVIQPELAYRLSWFDGEDAGGTWTLVLRDDATGDGGTLNAWSIRVCEPAAPPACAPGTVPVTVFTSDFESGDAGFTHTGVQDEWERGLPTFVPITTCASGTNCWKTDLDNTYNASANQDLLSPAIDLTGVLGPVRASWSQRYHIESANFDHAFVDAQRVGAVTPARLWEWRDATMNSTVGNPGVTINESSGWSRYDSDVTTFLGQNDFQLRFHLDSDTVVQLTGLAVDDVTVTACRVPSADLSITKTDGVTTATPGGSVTYTITASNAGADGVTGGTVADTFPAPLTCTWTCVGAGGGTCTAAGGGNINDTVNLPTGGSVTYTASCTVSAAATGSLANTATVSSSVPDPNSANNSATDTDTLVPSADASITKTDGLSTATPGDSTTYTITASNAGPSNTTGTVADTFPAELSGCNWTCAGAGGGTCTPSGSGNINDPVTLPAGGSATYTATCDIASSATGTLSNTATVTGAASDPTPGNNSATDSDTLTPSADLSLGLTDGPDPIGVHRDLTYTLTVTNNGPSDSASITLTDTLPAGTTFVSSTPGSPTCQHSAGVVTCNLGDLGAFSSLRAPEGGGQTTVTIVVSTTNTGSPSDTASVSAGTSDPNSGNDSANTTTTVKFLKGDLDNDLNTELFINNTTSNEHRAWLMNGVLQSADSAINPATPASATQHVYGVDDFDGDFRNDLVFWNTATGAVEFWLMNGLNRLGSPVPIGGAPTLAPNWKLSATAEFNHDSKPDIVWRNTVSQKIVIWTMNGTTKLGNIIPTPDLAINSNWEIVAALDLNADGNTDFLWYNSTSGKIVYWWMDASVVRVTGNFTTPDAAGNNNWKVLAGGDYGVGSGGIPNSNDIVWRNATSGKFVVWYMDNAGIRTNGTFTTPDQPSGTPTDWIIVGPR